MAIDHTVRVETDVLLVKASGQDDNAEQVMAYGLAVIQECLQRGVKRVLCDERELQYRLNTVDTYAMAAFIAEQAPKVARVAIVCNPECVEDARFWETVAVNRGLIVKIFREMDAARSWLDQRETAYNEPPE